MRQILACLLWVAVLAPGWAQSPSKALQGPSKAGIPFSPTLPYSVRNVPNRTVNVPVYPSNYYYGYGGYGYGGYGQGYYDGNTYPAGPAGSYGPYRGSVQPGNNNYPSSGIPGYSSRGNLAPRKFPSAAQESSLSRDW